MHIWTEFSLVWTYYFMFDGFCGLFWSINAIFSVVILLNFYDALLKLSSTALTNLSIELPCVTGLKFPCDSLVLEAKLETLCLGASRPCQSFWCWTPWALDWLGALSNIKELLKEHRQNTIWHKSQQDPLWPTSQNIGNKNKK